MNENFSRDPWIYSKNLNEAKKVNISLRTIRGIFWLLFLGGLVWLFLFSPFFTVKAILVSGAKYTPAEEIKKIVENSVEMNKNIFLLNTNPIKESVIKQYPEISDLRIYRGIPNAIKVVVAEREGILIWQTGGEQYVVDELGIAYKKPDENTHLPIIIDSNNIPIRIGEKILTSQFSEFARVLAKDFEDKTNLNIRSMEISESTFELHVITDKNLKILFDTSKSAETQLDKLAKVFRKIEPEIKEYVDLRVEDWVYYK